MADERIDIEIRDRINDSIAIKLTAIATKAKEADVALTGLNQKLGQLRFGTFTSGVNSASGAIAQKVSWMQRLNGTYINTSGVLNALRQRFFAFSQAVTATGESALHFIRILRTLASIVILASATAGIINAIDSYRRLQNQLRTTTDNQRQLEAVSNELFRVSDAARVPIGDLARTYRRFDMAIAAAGGSQKESLRITETMAKALTLSGASATEAGSALLQMSQAFNKGKLDGDEFRTTAELMPGVLNKIVQVLGTTRAKIFDLSKDGKITVDVLRKAFALWASEVDRQMNALPRTVGNALTQLFNAVIKFFGELNEKWKITERINSFIDWIRNNLPTILKLLQAIGAALAVMVSGAIIGSLFSIVGAFISLGAILGSLVGFMTFFADKIKVTADGLVTFGDLISSIFSEIQSFVFGGESAFGKLFSPESAQFLFDNVLVPGWNAVKSILLGIIPVVQAILQLFQQFSARDFFQGIGEAIPLLGAALFNTLVSVAQAIIPVFFAAFDKIANGIRTTFGFAGNVHTDVSGDVAALEKIKFKLNEVAPQLTKFWDSFSTNAEANFSKTSQAFDNFENRIIERARQSAIERAAIDGNLFQQLTATIAKGVAQATQYFLQLDNIHGQSMGRMIRIMNDINGNALRSTEAFGAAVTANANTLQNIWTTALTTIWTLIQQIQNAIASIGSSIQGILGKASAAASALAGIAASGGNPLAGIAGSALGSAGSSPLRGPDLALQSKLLQQIAQDNQNAAAASDNFTNRATNGMNGLNDATQGYLGTFQQLAQQAFGHVTDAIIDFTNTGKFEFKKMLKAIVDDLLRFFLNRFFNKLLTNIFGLGFGGGGGGLLGGLFGGGLGGGFGGFASGGYTGNIGVNRVAGVVHGQEFVMPAGATKRYRPMLESMRAGSPVGIGGSTKLNITVENYGSSKIEVQRISESDVRIIATEVAEQTVNSRTPRLVANEVRNANSRVSKALGDSTNARRKR